jgi:hypothetical protein
LTWSADLNSPGGMGDLLADAGFELTRLTDRLPPFDYRVIEGAPV